MKWGKRNAAIKSARAAQRKKTRDIAKSAAKLPFAEKGTRKVEVKKLIDKADKLWNDGDRKIAKKSTTGEMALAAVMLAGAGAVAYKSLKV